MAVSVSHAREQAVGLLHFIAARPSTACGVTQNDPSWGASTFQADESVSIASNLTQATTSPRSIVQDRAEQDLDVRPDSQAAASNPRRMVAVTVALSEPADGSPLDWSETVASVLRLAFANTSVHVIDTWRCDQ